MLKGVEIKAGVVKSASITHVCVRACMRACVRGCVKRLAKNPVMRSTRRTDSSSSTI